MLMVNNVLFDKFFLVLLIASSPGVFFGLMFLILLVMSLQLAQRTGGEEGGQRE
jgi:hypothetical protein